MAIWGLHDMELKLRLPIAHHQIAASLYRGLRVQTKNIRRAVTADAEAAVAECQEDASSGRCGSHRIRGRATDTRYLRKRRRVWP